MGKEFLTCCVALDQCLKLPDLQFLHHKNESIMSEQQISNVCPFKSQGLVNKPISLASTPGFSLNIACMRPRNLYLSDTPPPHHQHTHRPQMCDTTLTLGTLPERSYVLCEASPLQKGNGRNIKHTNCHLFSSCFHLYIPIVIHHK